MRQLHYTVLHATRRSIKSRNPADGISSDTTAVLLRYTGGLCRNLKADARRELTESAWSLADKNALDVSHYNALLQVRPETVNGIVDRLQEATQPCKPVGKNNGVQRLLNPM